MVDASASEETQPQVSSVSEETHPTVSSVSACVSEPGVIDQTTAQPVQDDSSSNATLVVDTAVSEVSKQHPIYRPYLATLMVNNTPSAQSWSWEAD